MTSERFENHSKDTKAQISEIYEKANAKRCCVEGFRWASKFVGYAQVPTFIRIEDGTIGKEDEERLDRLCVKALEKGCILHYNPINLLETLETRKAARVPSAEDSSQEQWSIRIPRYISWFAGALAVAVLYQITTVRIEVDNLDGQLLVLTAVLWSIWLAMKAVNLQTGNKQTGSILHSPEKDKIVEDCEHAVIRNMIVRQQEAAARKAAAPSTGVIWFEGLDSAGNIRGLDKARLPFDPNITFTAARAFANDPANLALVIVKASNPKAFCEYADRIRSVAEAESMEAHIREGEDYVERAVKRNYTSFMGRETQSTSLA